MNTPQTSRDPAEVYDSQFVPALFAQWGPIVSEAAGIGPGHRVLGVACWPVPPPNASVAAAR